jgi:hypothetical protein
MSLADHFAIALRLVILMAGLLLPGSMLLRALRLPWSLAAAFVASAGTLYIAILVFAWTGAVISFATLAAALGLVTLAARLTPGRAPTTRLSSSFASFQQMGPWLPLYGLFWLVVAWRLGVHPANGPDVAFRWSWLGEQMLQATSLDFYPPRSAGDFVRYFWAESIPPGIAGLYAWSYACGGSNHALWTSPVVALQLLALHELVWRLASRWGGEVVARRAVLLAAACPLLTWSVLLGQETGATAIAVTGLVWCLQHLRDNDGDRWAILAGIFAIVAASSREYGVIFPVVAVGAALWLQAAPRQAWIIALTALPIAAAWPLRVWLLTGNPFHSLNVAGLFETNAIFAAWNDTLRGPLSHALSVGENWTLLLRYLILWALPALLGFVALVVLAARRLRATATVALFVGLVAALWFVSVGYTAGGLFYSLRVLSPAFALLAIVAGYALSLGITRPAASRLVAAVLAVLLVESLPKTLVLPENPYRVPPGEWLRAADRFPAEVRGVNDALVAALQPLPDRRRVLSDHAGLPQVLSPIGTEVAPLWSPEVAWLFDATLPPEEIARRWHATGMRYVILGKTGPSAGFVQAYARWRVPFFAMRTIVETDTHVILDVTVPDEAPH